MAISILRTPEHLRQETYLHELAPQANGTVWTKDGFLYPIPIFTAVIDKTQENEQIKPQDRYEWFELTPWKSGSTYLKAWIDTSAFGKKFERGESHDLYNPERLGFVLGMCGSAYAASFAEMLSKVCQYAETQQKIKILADIVSQLSTIGKTRISPPKVLNYAYKMSGIPMQDKQTLTIMDAALDFNLPMPPLFRRNVSIYIICDASVVSLVEQKDALNKVEAWAQKNGLKFPKIDYMQASSQKVSIFSSTGPSVPLVIYVSSFVEEFSTFKFEYKPEESEKVIKGMEDAVIVNKDVIKNAIKQWIKNQKGKTVALKNKMKYQTV